MNDDQYDNPTADPKRKHNDTDDVDGTGAITTARVAADDHASTRHSGVGGDRVNPWAWPEQDDVPLGWAGSGYTSAAAVAEWTSIGIDSPLVAAQWINAGFTPEQASGWVEISDMSPSEAMEAVNNGVAPIDIERVRRADPDWTRPEDPSVADPDMGVWM